MIELLEEKLEVNGTSDPGSQVSLINPKLIKINKEKKDINKIILKTNNGMTQIKNLIRIKLKIFEIEEYVDVFIVEKEDFKDLIIG